MLAAGSLPQPIITHDAGTGEVTLTFVGLPGVNYRLEASQDLVIWDTVEDFIGDGTPHPFTVPRDQPSKFFRFFIIP